MLNMTSIGAVVGGVVGIFLAIIIGLTMVSPLVDAVVDAHGANVSYVAGEYQASTGSGTTPTAATINITVDSDGGVATAAPKSGSAGTGYVIGDNISLSSQTLTGSGAELRVATIGASGAIATLTIVSKGGPTTADVDKFIATSTILGVLPLIAILSLFVGGAALGGMIGRMAQERYR